MELYELLEHSPEHGALDASKFEELSDLGFSLIRLEPFGKAANREQKWQEYCGVFRHSRDSRRNPDENMGIGVGPASGVVCIDIDDPDQFIKWCVNNNVSQLPSTRIHKSPKGWHIFFRRWEGLNEEVTRIIRKDMGCDLMFNKTQVVAPGSVVKKEDGNVYSYIVVDEALPAAAPDWVVALVVQQDPERRTEAEPVRPEVRLEGSGTASASAYLAKWLDTVEEHPIPEGERNETLFKILSGAAGIGANRNMIMSYASKLGAAMGIPRFEAMKTGESAAKKPANKIKESASKKVSEIPPPADGIGMDIMAFLDNVVGEFEVAKAIENYFCDKFRYCRANHKWYRNNNNIWEESGPPDVLSPVLDFMRHFIDMDDDIKEALKKQYVRWQSANSHKAVMELLKSSDSTITITESDFDRNAMKLPMRNAVVEMVNGKPSINVRPLRWEDYIRKTIDIDWPGEFGEYDAAKLMTLKDESFKEFDTIMNRIFHVNPELKPLVVKLLGYALSGTQEKIKKLPIMIGEGNNGKSVLFRALQCSLAPMAMTVDKSVVVSRGSDSAPKPELLVLQGARIGFIGETEETDYLNESTVKALTGGDIRTARNLYSAEMVQLQPTYTLMLATNHEPRIASGGAALWNRILPIPFNTVFTANPTRPDELPLNKGVWEWCDVPHVGIVIYLLFGWLRYCADGLGELPECVTTYLRQYKEEEDPYSEFRDECLVQVEVGCESSRSLVIAYRNWCNDHQITLNNRLSDRGIKRGILASTKEWGTCEKKNEDCLHIYNLEFKPLQDTYSKPRPIRSHYEKSF